jgi:hypothetical protein
MDSSMFCLYVYFCTADYRRLLLIDFQIPAEVQKDCVYTVKYSYRICRKQLYLDSDMVEDTW